MPGFEAISDHNSYSYHLMLLTVQSYTMEILFILCAELFDYIATNQVIDSINFNNPPPPTNPELLASLSLRSNNMGARSIAIMKGMHLLSD